MRKIKIKEKNHNLRIKYKEGEWQSAESVATALCAAATQVIFESMIDDSDKKQFFDAMPSTPQRRPVLMALRNLIEHSLKSPVSSARGWINRSIDLNAL